jgi:tRNA 2-thiouridine synthesizing protein C
MSGEISIPAKLLYVISGGPYSNAQGQEALDAILIGASFEQAVSVLFIHDGVFQLKSTQSNSGLAIKRFTKTYKALFDFGVENVYVHDLSLLARGLIQGDLIIDTQLLNSDELSLMISEQARVFTF